MAHIYKITSPSGKIYIGSSVNVSVRFRKYKNGHCKNQSRLYNSFLKHGINNHIFEIITECDKSEMYKLEAEYGLIYDVLGENGLNCRLPNLGDLYKCVSEETIKKIRDANTGKKPSEECLRKASLANKGKKLSDEHKEKLAKSQIGKTSGMLGKKHSEETKAKMSIANKLIIRTPEWNNNLAKSLAKPDRKYSKYNPVNILKKQLGRTFSDERRKKISLVHKGKKMSDDFKRKQSEARIGIKRGPYKKKSA